MKKAPFILFIFFAGLLFISCRKKVIEIVPVIDYVDISIPEDADLKCFSFPSPKIGYAGVKNIYKTTDGGRTWTMQKLAGDITSIEFLNEKIGFCTVNRSLYKTLDGGENWKPDGLADFVCVSQNKWIVITNTGALSVVMKVSKDTGKTFLPMRSLYMNGKFTTLRVHDNKVFVLHSQVYSQNMIEGNDLLDTGKIVRMEAKANAYENPSDFYYSPTASAVVGFDGYIGGPHYATSYYLAGYARDYFGHTYQYNSIDGYDGLMVAVGYKTMTTNMNIQNGLKWNELLNSDRNGFDQTFLRIRFYDKKTFFVSGTHGLLWRAII